MTEKELRERLDEMAIEHEVSLRFHDKDIRELSDKIDSLPWKLAGITIALMGLFLGLTKLFP